MCSRNKLLFAHHQKKHFGFWNKNMKTGLFPRCFYGNMLEEKVKLFFWESLRTYVFISGTNSVLFAAFHHKSDVNFLILFCNTKTQLYLDFKCFPPPFHKQKKLRNNIKKFLFIDIYPHPTNMYLLLKGGGAYFKYINCM